MTLTYFIFPSRPTGVTYSPHRHIPSVSTPIFLYPLHFMYHVLSFTSSIVLAPRPFMSPLEDVESAHRLTTTTRRYLVILSLD